MTQIHKLSPEEQKKIFDQVIKLKQKGWNFEDVAFHCDISIYSAWNIIKKAKTKGVKFPNIVGGDYSRYRTKKPEIKQEIQISETRQKLTQPIKHLPMVKITKHFSTTKDFWLFKN
jgi:transposase